MLLSSTHRDQFLQAAIFGAPPAPAVLPPRITISEIDATTAAFDQVKLPDPNSMESLTDFIATYLKWVDFQFAMLDQVYQALRYLVALDVATCDELSAYNAQAKGVFFEAEFMRRALKSAGVPNVPLVPMPGMFGHTAYELTDQQGNLTDIDVRIQCSADGYPAAGLRANPLERRTKAGPLGIAPAVVPLIWGGAILLGGLASWLIGAGIARVLNAFPTTVQAQLTADMHQATLAGDAKRAKLATDCLSQEMLKLTPAQQQDRTERRRVFDQCRQLAVTAMPDRPPPKLPGGLGIGKTVLYVGLGVGIIFLSVAAYRMATVR